MDFGGITQLIAFSPPFRSKTCFGLVVRYHRETFVLTCLDGVSESKQITMPDKNLNLQIHKQFKPYNLAILSSADTSIKLPFEDSKRNFLQSLPDNFDALYIEDTLDKTRCLHNCFTIGHLKSNLVPKTPLMQIDVPGAELRDLVRFFGCPVVDGTGNICAMITHYNGERKMLRGLPSNCLTHLFKMTIDDKMPHGFCFRTSISKLGDNQFGHKVISGFHTMETSDGEEFTFKKHDFIYKIDDNHIDEYGAIYSKTLDSRVPLEVYFLYDNKDYHTFNFLQDKIHKKVSISPLQLDKYTKMQIDIGEQYYFNGLIVAELSEEFLRTVGQKYNIGGLVNYHYNNVYANFGQKIVIIHDIDIANKTFSAEYEKIGLPLLGTEEEYYIPVLTHINGNPILNLETLKHCTEAKSARLRIQYTNEKTEAINLKYGNGVKVLKTST